MILDKVNSPADLKSLDRDELEALAGEIREFLIEKVTRTGGHLSPNLGVVELTIAIHKVFDAPKDDIVWDVGHQTYVHKILTGRKNEFDGLRCEGGLSGFTSPKESVYDVVHAGHSSTSLSIAAGIAMAKRLKGDKSATVAVIGDGAFTAGMVYEALNSLAHYRLPVVIILNDNGMSISKNVGGISNYFNHLRTSHSYIRFKRGLEKFLNNLSRIGRFMERMLYKTKQFLKEIFMPGRFFQDMGINYYGPFDGHNIEDLTELLEGFKDTDRPVLIHIETKKGKGYEPSETDPCGYHGIKGISINGDGSIPIPDEGKSYSSIFGETLCELAKHDNWIVAVTAAMGTGTGLSEFAKLYPDRFDDVGIAEQHAVTYALGLSLKGYKPVVAIYSTFLQRGYDQLVHDIGIAKAKVLFCIDRSGLVPGDGETHQGIFDIAFLRTIPNFTVMAPACGKEFVMMLKWALSHLDGPIAIRYPKEAAADLEGFYDPEVHPLDTLEPVTVRKGADATVVCSGTVLEAALAAAKVCEKKKVRVEIINLRFIKPINNKVLGKIAASGRPLLVIEEGVRTGGTGEFIAAEVCRSNPSKKVEILSLPDEFPGVGSREGLLSSYQLTADKIADKICFLAESN